MLGENSEKSVYPTLDCEKEDKMPGRSIFDEEKISYQFY